MEYDSFFDLEEILKTIESTEIMSIFFPIFLKSVVIDTRSNSNEGPMIRVVPMAGSPQERLRSLSRMSPSFPRATNLKVIPWRKYVESLVELGVWSSIENRFKSRGDFKSLKTCQKILTELRQMEKKEMADVVVGKNYQTIWSAGTE